jgi:hypothetical protein
MGQNKNIGKGIIEIFLPISAIAGLINENKYTTGNYLLFLVDIFLCNGYLNIVTVKSVSVL